jgi:sensor domain CHASE-containing protein
LQIISSPILIALSTVRVSATTNLFKGYSRAIVEVSLNLQLINSNNKSIMALMLSLANRRTLMEIELATYSDKIGSVARTWE